MRVGVRLEAGESGDDPTALHREHVVRPAGRHRCHDLGPGEALEESEMERVRKKMQTRAGPDDEEFALEREEGVAGPLGRIAGEIAGPGIDTPRPHEKGARVPFRTDHEAPLRHRTDVAEIVGWPVAREEHTFLTIALLHDGRKPRRAMLSRGPR